MPSQQAQLPLPLRIRKPRVSRASDPFKIGDQVTWSSQAAGHTRMKNGVIAEVVQAGQRPDRERFKSLYTGNGVGFGRTSLSYVVCVGTRFYWPRAHVLQPALPNDASDVSTSQQMETTA